MEKTGFIYLWFDRFRKMYYIGCHWGTESDGYICSSDRMREAHRRRPQDFKRRIIQRNIPREKLLDEEFKWLSLIPDKELGRRYYNHSKKHFGHWANNPNQKLTVGEKISKAHTGKPAHENTKKALLKCSQERISVPRSEETKQKISASHTGKEKPWAREYRLNNPMSAESIEKANAKKRGKPAPWVKGGCSGPRSEETKQKIREKAFLREAAKREARISL